MMINSNSLYLREIKHVCSVVLTVALFGSTSAYASWCAIASSSKSKNEVNKVVKKLGYGWSAINTKNCPNMTQNLWIAAACVSTKAEAQSYASGARDGAHIRDAYVKICNRASQSKEESFEEGSDGVSPDYQ
jgi:hypothetical protein